MKITVTKDYDDMSKAAAEIIISQLKKKPDSVLGLATGTSPLGLYKLLIEAYKKGEISFAQAQTVNLDEYVGLKPSHSQSYAYFMHTNLFDHVDILPQNVHIPQGFAENLSAECASYSKLLGRLKPDIQLLGIGSNGHIGFNEPNSAFSGTTHLVNLTESTVKDNSRLFDDISQVPRQAITMGIAEIMSAKSILLLANGTKKAQAILKTVKGEISESCPASILQRHPNCNLVIDEAAAALL